MQFDDFATPKKITTRAKQRPDKPRNVKARWDVNGRLFETEYEAYRYKVLMRQFRQGEITALSVYEPWAFVYEGKKLWDFRPTFTYRRVKNGEIGPLRVEHVTEPYMTYKKWLDPMIILFEASTGHKVNIIDHRTLKDGAARMRKANKKKRRQLQKC